MAFLSSLRSVLGWKRCMLLACLLFVSCNELLLPKEPKSTPQGVFDQLWQEFNLRYANFSVRGVNWDSLGTHYREMISESSADSDLMHAFDSILAPLHDLHVYVSGGHLGFNSRIPQWDSIYVNKLEDISTYYLKSTTALSKSRNLVYGTIDDSIGYIAIRTFSSDANVAGWENEIDAILQQLGLTKGLVLDVRNNDGGEGTVMQAIAGRFYDVSRVFAYSQTRNGAGPDDLSIPQARSVSPQGTLYRNPVIVLSNRHTVSAAEWFVMAMSVVPGVRIVGDTTSGCFSMRMDRQLQNGWIYGLASQRVSDADHICYEGRGFPPGVEVYQSVHTRTLSKDSTLDVALKLLK